ncbi:hypothetical protein [Paraburkholderia dilworthii]|uniref:hypothetical protein n=1 Tax=Paraburkholderia dilworthii TaxID=948106 RepID=UPI0003FC17B2|nr:hypothetical protein [Paraburkholderia dilworthii]
MTRSAAIETSARLAIIEQAGTAAMILTEGVDPGSVEIRADALRAFQQAVGGGLIRRAGHMTTVRLNAIGKAPSKFTYIDSAIPRSAQRSSLQRSAGE